MREKDLQEQGCRPQLRQGVPCIPGLAALSPPAVPEAQDVGALHTRSATSFSIRLNHCLLLHLRFSMQPVLLPAAEREWGLIS